MRRQLGLDADDVVVVLVAALRPEKRADLFVEAVVRARREDPRIRGLVVGDGPELPRIRARAETTGGAVLVLGERSDVPDLMSCADAVCVTSYAEALPITVLEAMAVGRPVIATAVGGVPEVIAHRETGLLVSSCDPGAFAEAILELAARPERGRAMGDAARARFLNGYTVELMVERYVDMLSEIGPAKSS
jgi:glycosyltransferase involved in cell wall biosynthesis